MSRISGEARALRNAVEAKVASWGFEVSEDMELGELEFRIVEGAPEDDAHISQAQLRELLDSVDSSSLEISWWISARIPSKELVESVWNAALEKIGYTATIFSEGFPMDVVIDGQLSNMQLATLLDVLCTTPEIVFDPTLHVPME